MTLTEVRDLLSRMSAERRTRAVTWARDCLRLAGDQWALRTWGPIAIGADPPLGATRWLEYPDTLKAIYNTCGGWPHAPLPAHGLISKPRWWP